MTNTQNVNPMPRLIGRLADLGFPEDWIRSAVLPDWWDDEICDTPAGFAEGCAILARLLGLDCRSLRYGDGPIAHAEPWASSVRAGWSKCFMTMEERDALIDRYQAAWEAGSSSLESTP
jgi:hypothetical protein